MFNTQDYQTIDNVIERNVINMNAYIFDFFPSYLNFENTVQDYIFIFMSNYQQTDDRIWHEQNLPSV